MVSSLREKVGITVNMINSTGNFRLLSRYLGSQAPPGAP
jgi:hypothetical protein